MSQIRIVVTGDRRWYCLALAERVVRRMKARYGDDLVIVHGKAPGVDSAFDSAADLNGVRTEPHPAQWDVSGPAAGPLRNQGMVDLGAMFCLAVHRNIAGSKGTKDCVRRCLKAEIPVWLIDSEDAEPRPLTRI